MLKDIVITEHLGMEIHSDFSLALSDQDHYIEEKDGLPYRYVAPYSTYEHMIDQEHQMMGTNQSPLLAELEDLPFVE